MSAKAIPTKRLGPSVPFGADAPIKAPLEITALEVPQTMVASAILFGVLPLLLLLLKPPRIHCVVAKVRATVT